MDPGEAVLAAGLAAGAGLYLVAVVTACIMLIALRFPRLPGHRG